MVDNALAKTINEHYQKGEGSIQDIARVYHVSVEEVLHVIGQDEVATVQTVGDQIDASEAGPGATVNYDGKTYNVPFSLD